MNSGRHLAFQAHFSHPRELSTPIVQDAIRRIQLTGATIRAQAPLINHGERQLLHVGGHVAYTNQARHHSLLHVCGKRYGCQALL